MNIKKILFTAGLAALSSQVMAIPSLQLDIDSPTTYYDTADETVMTTNSAFTLQAYLDETNTYDPAGNYRVSVAITPKQDYPQVDVGSFEVDGEVFNIGNLFFGTPAVETYAISQGIAPHGIFETYYAEIDVDFTTATSVAAYNVQDPTSLVGPGGHTMLLSTLEIDMSGLLTGLQLHFDLYQVDAAGEIIDFAPFSHDAGTAVPEPGVLALLGFGLIGISAAKRKTQLG